MRQRKLGRQLTVSEQGLGCMGMSAFYGARDVPEAINAVHSAIDRGGAAHASQRLRRL